jgi:methionyl-tRNA formyltransferase
MTKPKLSNGANAADLFADVIDDFLSDKIVPKEQDHDLATFTSLFKKTDGLIDLKDSPENNYFKYLALKSSVGIYFFVLHGDTKVRVKVSEAVFEDGIFVIKKVIPEGRKEIFYEDFKNGLK